MRPRLAALGTVPIRRIPWNKTYSSAPRISLAYDLHEPSKPSSNAPRPIIFMHGLFGSKKNNRSISKALARDLGRPVYAVDLRNHGDSPHSPSHDYMAMADDVAGFIEEHQLKKSTLIGHSMGAKTAMTVALKAPDIIDNIVSVDNAPLDAALLSNFGKYIQGMRKIEEAGVTRQSEADKILQDYEEASTPISRGLSLPVRQFLLGNLHRPPGEKTQKFKVPLRILGSALDNLGDFPFKDPGEVRFEKPALFVRGTQSKYVPDEALPIIGQFFPRFVLADIDAGHWVISEKPEEFRQEFLKPQE
ncbi:Abhydrolase domain-containing protein [Lachnellula occidentalis]|uniref:Abhydrolase domain-containing protein n=1 Tax=Lachnellula occidentalis TaxID=215460 RepID=A0A8H8S9F7_9HELO|nr:Abhydrolase domain-containing protein [Lachnellula occidentalis]